MKVLLLAAVAAVAGVSYVGYSYSSTDGKSCLVCPMTGEPIFTSSETEASPCGAGAGGDVATLTSLRSERSSCCQNSGSGCCAEDADVTLTSAANPECTGQCEKGCCKDQESSADVTNVEEETTTEGTENVVADNNGT